MSRDIGGMGGGLGLAIIEQKMGANPSNLMTWLYLNQSLSQFLLNTLYFGK
jgi:hypothetical protein